MQKKDACDVKKKKSTRVGVAGYGPYSNSLVGEIFQNRKLHDWVPPPKREGTPQKKRGRWGLAKPEENQTPC